MRLSGQIYKTKENKLIGRGLEEAQKGETLYIGYNYKDQYWVFKGEKDTRTLEEIKKTNWQEIEEMFEDYNK